MCVVRLLLRRGTEVFCVPRDDSGKLDLPIRHADQHDFSGVEAIQALASSASLLAPD
jgi:hypothetical protein